MRLSVPSTEFTEASRVDAALVEVDRRTATRSTTVLPNGTWTGYAIRPPGSGVSLVGTDSASVITASASVAPGRRYRIDIDLSAAADGSGFTGLETRLAYVPDAEAAPGSPVLRYWPFTLPGGTVWDHLTGFAVYDAPADTAGSVGLCLWVQGTTAGRNYSVIGNATVEAQLLVTDIGPAPQS